jgi:CBS domain-containing protein
MKVSALMTSDPATCTPETSIRDVARLMVQHDCGEIPVVQSDRRLVGVVTDRDIVCRAVADGKSSIDTTARECMSTPVVSVEADTDLEDALNVMEQHQIRRIPVVDRDGCCCGILSQADIAIAAPARETAELVREVSRQ